MGIRYLADVLAYLDLRSNRSVLLLDSSKLVYASEYRIALRRDKTLAYAEAVDLRTLSQEIRNYIFVKGVRRKDFAVRQPRLIEDFPRLSRKIRDVSRVDANRALRPSRGKKVILYRADCVRKSGFKHAVGIYEESGILGIKLDILTERIIFGIKHLHPRMSHSAARRHSENLIRKRARGRCASSDIAARAPSTAASSPCARRDPNSEIGRPSAARTMRLALVATSD